MKPDQIFSAGSVGVQWELRGRCGAWKLGSRVPVSFSVPPRRRAF
jgi:hypothetical protein